MSDRNCADAAQAAAQAYRLALAQYSQMLTIDIWYARLDTNLLIEHAPDDETRNYWMQIANKAFASNLERAFQQLTQDVNGQRRFIDNPPLLYHPPHQAEYFEQIEALFEQYRDTLQVLSTVILAVLTKPLEFGAFLVLYLDDSTREIL